MSVRLVVKISCCGIIEKVKFVERRAGKDKLIYLLPFIFLAFRDWSKSIGGGGGWAGAERGWVISF